MPFTREILGVAESPLVRIATLAESMTGSIKLCYGESDVPTPDFVLRAADEAARAGHTFYTNTAGYGELREAIAAKVLELHGVEYRGSEIMSTVGATMGIFTAIRACVGPGDNAVIVTPTYGIFTNAVTLARGEPRHAALAGAGDGLHLDLDRVRSRIDGRTRMLIVNSPSNPSGWVIGEDEQRALYSLAEEHDLVLLSDEVYDRLVYDGSQNSSRRVPVATSFAAVVPNRERLIVVNSFSKTYSMTGSRLGWVQASERTIRLMSAAAEFITSNPAAMIQQAGITALRDGETFVSGLREEYRRRRDQAVAGLSAMAGLSVSPPRGAFYAFVRVEGLADSAALALDILHETGVALAPGSAFGEGGEGHIRLCFAMKEATLGEALERLGTYRFDRPGPWSRK